jgi:hypothetical protein
MTANDDKPDVHSPMPLMVHLQKPVRVFNKPVMCVPQIDLSTLCKEASLVSRTLRKKSLLLCVSLTESSDKS